MVTENPKCVHERELGKRRGGRMGGGRMGGGGKGRGEGRGEGRGGKGEGERLLTPCLEFPLEFSIKVFQLCCECE